MKHALEAGILIVAVSMGFCGGYVLGYYTGSVDSMAYTESERAMKMAHCAQTEALSSTVRTETGDIDICVFGSHRMERIQ